MEEPSRLNSGFKAVSVAVALGLTVSFSVFADEPTEEPKSKTKKEQVDKGTDEDKAIEEDKKKKKEPTYAELIEDHIEDAGFMTFFREEKSGAMLWSIPSDMIGTEMIHFAKVEDGTAAVGQFRGGFGGESVFKIERFYDRIEVRAVNTQFYFDKDNAISNAKDANINSPILFSAKIKAEDKDTGAILVDADAMLLTEALYQIKSPQRPPSGPGPKPFGLGSLDKKATKVVDVDNYPENTDVVVEYAYKQNGAGVVRSNNANMSLTDRRSVTLKWRHSFIKLPDNDYVARADDPRVGYFGIRGENMTSKGDFTPYNDMINRWHLVKKDPDASVSDPVEPIHWWIENTTPVEYREGIRQGVLAWNKAFEAAGFSNAMKVSVQPDDAEWDAGDIRYNVIRWTSSPQPFFGGYGPSFGDPRTGQLLGADIMLEYASVVNRARYEAIYGDMASFAFGNESSDAKTQSATDSVFAHEPIFNAMQSGLAMLQGADADYSEQLTNEFVAYLTLHEVGHTLGLNHNMKASQLHDANDVHNAELTSKVGLIGSVMDYPSPNFAPNGKTQGQFYTTTPGPYDLWAIQFGYDPDLSDADKMAAHLAKSNDPELAFGNDADDMRSAGGGGIDPRVMIGDMSSQAIDYAEQRMERINTIAPQLKERMALEGASYQGLLWATYSLMREYRAQAGVASRYVGGVKVERGFVGQDGDTQPFTPVSVSEQKAALALLSDKVWAPNALEWAFDLAPYLQAQRRSFDFFGGTEDPKLLSRIFAVQTAPLDHIMSPVVLNRLEDSSVYGNELSASDMLSMLTEAMFEADSSSKVSLARQNLQRAYVERLMMITKASGSVTQSVEAAARFELEGIYDSMSGFFASDESKAHRNLLKARIKKALELDR